MFFAFLKLNTKLIIRKAMASRNPKMATTRNKMWGTKFESDISLLVGRSTSLGIKIKTRIRMKGIITPMILQTQGFDELRHARHHIMLNTMAIIMINVPIPMPKTVPVGVWQLTVFKRLHNVISNAARVLCYDVGDIGRFLMARLYKVFEFQDFWSLQVLKLLNKV